MEFRLSNKEVVMVKMFEGAHKCSLRQPDGEIYIGAIGGNLTYMFKPTGLGVITTVRCACGGELDLTDWESW